MSDDDKETINNSTKVQVANRWYASVLTKIGLPHALGLVIAATCLLVTVGYLLYWQSNYRKYDIARPGQVSDDLEEDITDTKESGTAAIDTDAVTKKLEFLSKEQPILQGMNNFESSRLSDQNLRLTDEQPSF